MTTIVYRDGILAADGRVTRNDMIIGDNFQKIHSLPDGSAVGFAGRPDECQPLIDWLMACSAGQQAGPMPEIEESTAVHVRADGTVRILAGESWFDVNEPFFVAGSGSEAALGALHGGANAVDAVKAACRVDPFSGGNIRMIVMSQLVKAPAPAKAPRKTARKRPASKAAT